MIAIRLVLWTSFLLLVSCSPTVNRSMANSAKDSPKSKNTFIPNDSIHPIEKKALYLHLSLPHINNFYLKPEGEGLKVNTGFWGLAVGLDYYYQRDRFINFSVSGVSDFFVPVPAAVNIEGEYELMSSRYLGVSNHYKLNRWSLGYGVTFTRHIWNFRNYDSFDLVPVTRDPVKKGHNAFGLILSTYCQTGKRFHLGLIYRPTFFRLNSARTFEYEHVVSLDFTWKLRLGKRRSGN